MSLIEKQVELLVSNELMYKLTHGLIDIDTRKYLIHHSEGRTRGSYQFKFRPPYTNTALGTAMYERYINSIIIIK